MMNESPYPNAAMAHMDGRDALEEHCKGGAGSKPFPGAAAPFKKLPDGKKPKPRPF